MVRLLVYPVGGGLPETLDFEAADSLSDALVLDLRPTDAENVLKGGATEYSFDVPQTPINRRVFDDWQNWQRSAGTATLYRDAILEVDGFPARLGKIALMSATDEVARLTMFFDSEDPFRALQDLRVNELNWDVVDSDLLNLAFGNDYNLGGTNVATVPAKLRSWPLDGNGDRVVTNADFYPCISVKSIFYQALQRTTPTAPATLDFIAQWCGSDVFENLVIFLNKNRDYDKEYLRRAYGALVGQYNFTLAVPAGIVFNGAATFLNNDSTLGFYDNNNDFDTATATYTAPYDGNYDFEVVFVIGPNFPVAPNRIFLSFVKNGVLYVAPSGPFMVNGNTYSIRLVAENVPMVAGDTMLINWFSESSGGTWEIQSAIATIGMTSSSYNAGSSPMLAGGWIPRDWSVADVFRDVFRMFNLRMFWDSVRQNMAIAPARRWFNQLDGQTYSGFMTQPETDWTDLVVEPPSEVVAERWAWDYWLLHREPADEWLKKQSALSEVRSAGGRINTGRDGAQRNEAELEQGAAMAHIFDGTISDPAYSVVMLPMLLSKDHTLDPIGQTTFNEDDTCFYLMFSPSDITEGHGRVRTYDIIASTTQYYNCARGSQIPYDWDSNNNQIERPSLAFGNEVSVNGNPIPGLISNYHFGTIQSANSGKLMKAYIRLSSVALQTYTFDRPVRIGPRIFEVLRINGKPAESDIYEVTLQTIDYADAEALKWLQNPNSATYLNYYADPI